MSPFRIRLSFWLVALAALGLAACQGNIGNGGLPLQAPQGGFSPNAQAFAPSATRERTLEGAVYLTADMSELPLPSLAGFSVALELGTPPPDAAASAGPSPKASGSPSSSVTRTRAVSARSAASATSALPSAPGSLAPSAAPSPIPSASSSAAAGAVATSAAATASGIPAASPGPTASATSASGGVTRTTTALGSPKPGASPSAGPKVETKLVIYPDEAPSLPTPAPTGNIQVFEHRIPIVRAYVNSHAGDLALYGLGAARFTVPSEELAAGRGFTIAVFEAKKKYKGRMVAFDASANVSGSTISSAQTATALTLHKNSGYYLVLFGDQLAPTPLPSGAVPQPALPPGYATPATNPYGNYGTPNPYATSNPYATPNPYATLNPYASPAPH